MVGFMPDRDYHYLEVNRLLRRIHPVIVADTEAQISEIGGLVVRDPATDLLRVNQEFSVSVVVVRCHTTEAGGHRWKVRFDASLRPDITVADGRLDWPAVRAALPKHRGISVLSATRHDQLISAGAVGAAIDAGRSGGALVVCDVPRSRDDATCLALDSADLVVVVASGDVRCCAATAALAPQLTQLNPNVGLVVRGPSPGGLRPGEIADTVGLPLLAAMRPEPMLAEQLERGGLRLRARSPLAGAAGQVLGILRNGANAPRDGAA